MSRRFRPLQRGLLTLALPVLLHACASTGTSSPPDSKATPVMQKKSPALHQPGQWPNVSFTCDDDTLGSAVRAAGQAAGGGVVLMDGLALLPVEAASFKNVPLGTAVRQIASSANCIATETPWYYFIHPAGYESLLGLDVSGLLPAVLQEEAVALELGGSQALYNVLAMLGHGVRVTIVADNRMAEAVAGPLFLPQCPLGIALNAVLQSARISPNAFTVTCGDRYIFLHHKNSPGLASAFLGGESDSDAAERLEKRMTLILPENAADGTTFYPQNGPTPLARLLPALQRQTGFPVVLDPMFEEIPINPVVMHDMPLGLCLDLLLRQWPVPNVGYALREGRLELRRIPLTQP